MLKCQSSSQVHPCTPKKIKQAARTRQTSSIPIPTWVVRCFELCACVRFSNRPSTTRAHNIHRVGPFGRAAWRDLFPLPPLRRGHGRVKIPISWYPHPWEELQAPEEGAEITDPCWRQCPTWWISATSQMWWISATHRPSPCPPYFHDCSLMEQWRASDCQWSICFERQPSQPAVLPRTCMVIANRPAIYNRHSSRHRRLHRAGQSFSKGSW